MKVVLNQCYGGFSLSEKAYKMLNLTDDDYYELPRTDARLIEVVEKLGKEAGDSYSKLNIVNVPDEATDWEIDEYDGWEGIIYVLNGKIFHL